MARTTRMTIRVFAPASAAFFAAIVLMLEGWNLATLPMLTGMANAWDVLVGATLLAAVGLTAHGALQLRRWTQGRTLDCPSCGERVQIFV